MGEGGRVLDRLRQVADALLAEGSCGPRDENFLAEFRTQLNRCELAFALATRPLLQSWRENDFSDLSPYQTLRHDCKMASGPAASAVQVGEMAERLPKSRDALEAGRIGLAHLTLIAYTAEFVGEGFREEELLAMAAKLPVAAFARACTHYRHAAKPEAFAHEERQSHEDRFLELTTNAENGSVWLRGLLDAEGGAHLKMAIDALAQPLPQDDRTAAQRRADALVEISRVALDNGRLPEVNGVRPHLQISATVETLLGLPGAPAAELEGAGPISGEMLRRLAGDCSVRRVLLGEDSLVINVGRERRLFRGASRVALERRDGGCVWPGCTRPPRLCQADHIKPWWAGGQSVTTNGRLLCRYHHRLRSEGWELIEADNSWIAKPPIWNVKARAD